MEIGGGCMQYFGIKSYLDNFYDRQGDNEQHRNVQHEHLISSYRPKFSNCWWKFLLSCGSFIVFLGFFLLLIGFLLPRKKITVDSNLLPNNSQVIIIDRQALAYNEHLDTSHLYGICFIVIGGILFTLSLLIPTFCHMWCASEEVNDETDLLEWRMEISSSEPSVPIRGILKRVQPNYRKDESRLTNEGIVPLLSS